ncbi:MAG: response regulator [Deltaproteobacteria bacterium]|nr:response regulator [Deltaproteobacteria bacterium]
MDYNQKKQILIVDDNELNIDTLIATLGDEYDLRVAIDGDMALKLFEYDDLPDLILLDVMMPEMDGYEVCRRIKECERTRGIRIIFLTALTDIADQEKGLGLGAEDYITKPFNPAIVRARVRTQLKLKQYSDHLEDLVTKKTEQLLHAQEGIIASMAIMAEHRDPETGAHIQRTKSYVQILARAMAAQMPDILSEQTIEMLYRAAPLHDIGKVAIPDEILLKPGRLTAEETTIMQTHTSCGSDTIRRTEEIVGSNELLHLAVEIAEYHHEKWDGSGYPHGLEGDNIPLSARLMSIADVYDALISIRPYKPAFSHAEAVKIILKGDDFTRPEHFDPQILSCFARIHDQFDQIATTFGDS